MDHAECQTVNPDIILFIVYMVLIGAAIGTFTGLVPGIHVNTLAAMMLASYGVLKDLLSSFIPETYVPICLSSCIVAASVVHSFVDYVPSVFIGAPDPDDVVSMLPGHRLLNKGLGMSAVRSAAIGSCVGACASVMIAIPMQYLLFIGMGDYLDSITAVILIIVIIIMLLQEDSAVGTVWATVLLAISGLLGLACMDLGIPSSGPISEGTLLFPLLTGLFGIPTMLGSLNKTEIVPQTDAVRYPVGPIPGIKGTFTGMITGWFPGITATTGAIISNMFTPEKRPEGFISMTASIGTSASVMMIVTLSVSGKGRSGTMQVVNEIMGGGIVGLFNENFILLLITAAMAAVLGYHLTILCGKMMSSIVSMINTALLNRICLVLICTLVLLMTGPFGIMILVISTLVGMIPVRVGVSRIYLTGCLIIPTLLTYLGLRDPVLTLLC